VAKKVLTVDNGAVDALIESAQGRRLFPFLQELRGRARAGCGGCGRQPPPVNYDALKRMLAEATEEQLTGLKEFWAAKRLRFIYARGGQVFACER
jgi:hypothetical protein